jgi:carbon monoxide dehydrogenase subunit G
MFERTLAQVLTVLLIHPSANAALPGAQSMVGRDPRRAEQVKLEISKLAAGRETKVSVKLRDHTKLTGFIGQIEEERFILTNAKTGAATAVAYADVTQVKGHNLSTGAKIAIGIGIGVGVTVLTLYLLSLALAD